MTATYNTVTIGSDDYDVYADIATADAYLNAEVSAAATKWRDAAQTNEEAKARALVSATRVIDRQNWPGTKTDGDAQILEWPRTGTGLADIDEDFVPQEIESASILLAAHINNGVDVTGTDSTDDRIKRQKAGSVELEFFRDLDGGPRFPLDVQELLAELLAGGSVLVAASIATGVDDCSDFTNDYTPSAPL